MRDLQTMVFNSVDDLILSLPKTEQVLMKKLRSLILECLPKAIEKINYGVPFYVHNRMICFIWPPSIRWGPRKEPVKELRVTLGFCQGNLMANDDGVLLSEGRKQVYCMYFSSLKEINEDQIRALLFEAELIDDHFRKKKIVIRKNKSRG
jgi:hypothetical protein